MPSLGFMVSTPVVLALLGKLWPMSNRNLYMRTFVTPHKLLKWGRAWQLGTSAGHVVIRGLPSFSLSVLLSVVLAPFLAWSCDGCDWSTDPLRSGSEQRKEMSGFFPDLKSSFLEALPASLSSSLKSYWLGIGLWSFLNAHNCLHTVLLWGREVWWSPQP